MHKEKYSVKWHTYSDHLKTMMKELMMNEEFSDVTLVTEDKKHIKANIDILSACSSVFKDILRKEKGFHPIMYLRSIQYTEMESIIQFIYLGEATLHKERMGEFLAVAKSLEIKELCYETEVKNQPDDEPLPHDQETSIEQKGTTDDIKEQVTQVSREKADSNYDCKPCHKTFATRSSLSRHKKSAHEGVKFTCSYCDYQATQQSNLNTHIMLKHEGVKFACNQCDYEATHPSTLTGHIQSEHEGVKHKLNMHQVSSMKVSSMSL